MSAAPRDTTVEDIIAKLDRSHFEARNVKLAENSSFSQTQNVHVNIPGPSSAQPPDKIYDIPDQLSPYFLGRDDDLKRVRSSLEDVESEHPARCIVYGMPGMGKTQLALKYANTAKEKGWYSYIFWISATSREKFIQGYSSILHQIVHPSRTEPDREIQCKVAKAWLESQNKKWLLLLDNVTKETLTAMRKFMPQRNHNGHIVCTARTGETAGEAAKAHGQQYRCLELAKLATEDAIRLLTSKLATSPDQLEEPSLKAATQVVISAGCVPLVVFQAASYMEFSKQSLTQVSNTYKTARPEVLKWVSSDSSYYDEGTLAAVYSAALTKIRDSSPTTMDFLRILVFLDPEDIPIEILRNGSTESIDPSAKKETLALLRMSGAIPKGPLIKRFRQKKSLSSSMRVVAKLEKQGTSEDLAAAKCVQELLRSEVKLHEALQQLQELSIISQRNINSKATVWLHDLVQEILFKELLPQTSQQEFWLARAIQLVYNVQLKSIQALSPLELDLFAAQANTLTGWLDTYSMHSIMLIDLCDDLAQKYGQTGYAKQAKECHTWCFNKLKIVLGPKHSATLQTMTKLGFALRLQGKWTEAEKVLLSASNILKGTSGIRSESYLLNILYLGALYEDQGWKTEAAKLYIQCFSGNGVLDQNLYPGTTIGCLRRLGNAYRIQGRLKDAEEIYLQALRLATESYGSKSQAVARCMEFLSHCYYYQKELEKCIEMRLQVLDLLREMGESETGLFWEVMHNLALVYCQMGRLGEAKRVQEQVLERDMALCGATHPETVKSMTGLALTLKDCGRIKDAIALQERAVRSSEIVHDNEHQWTKEHKELLEDWRIEAKKEIDDEQQLDTKEQEVYREPSSS